MNKNEIKIGEKYLVTTDEWFFAPDGRQRKAVFGTVHGISTDDETLGVKTNARSTNWYLQIGSMIVAGCQIHYAIRTDRCNTESSSFDEVVDGEVKHPTIASSIYNADEDYK